MKLALVQMTSTNTHAGNIATAQAHIEDAAKAGCDMIAFPEVAGLMNSKIETDRAAIVGETDDPYIQTCRTLARDHGLWIHTGSTPILKPGEDRFFNHSNMINPKGEIVASYDKIHLFDIFPENAKPIQESKRYAPGTTPEIVETPWGKMGMSICYDLRFPALYRTYAQAGAVLMFIPSAFTIPTGKAHWEVLLRARAIETGAFIVAAAQVGNHDDGRKTYGHGMVVSPWGEVRLDMGDQTGLSIIDLDIAEVETARSRIPSLSHDRNFGRA